MSCWSRAKLGIVMSWLLLMVAAACTAQEPVTNTQGMTLRLIPAGHYIRGDTSAGAARFSKDQTGISTSDEQPPHRVRITRPFLLATTEVTISQFRKFVAATNYRTTAEEADTKSVGFKPVTYNARLSYKQPFNRDAKFNWQNPGFDQQDSHPVVCVSWLDAQAFCRWLSETEGVGYRLPTEAEWEYACRAGSPDAFSWGNGYRRLIHQKANIGNTELEKEHKDLVVRKWLIDVDQDPGDGFIYTAPVASFPANPWGLRDMHGNVWEWCHDTYSDTSYEQYRSSNYPVPTQTAVDPVNEAPWNDYGDWRVIRGGSWYVAPRYARSDNRSYFDATDSSCYIGFRVAREAPADVVATAKHDWDQEQLAINKLLEHIGDFHVPDGSVLERTARFRDRNPPAEATEGMFRISGLTGVAVNDVDGTFLQHIAKIKTLKSLDLYHLPRLHDDDLAALETCLSLERLSLTGRTNLTNNGMAHLAKLTNLKRLQLSGEGITDDGLMALGNLKQLTKLYLRDTKCRGSVLPVLRELPLQKLSLNDISDEDAAGLQAFPRLYSFACGGSSLTDKGLVYVGGLSNLTSLDLRGCRSIGASGFGPLRSLEKLKSLDLRDTQAGDAALRHLARHHNISSLAMDSENLTDAGMLKACGLISLDYLTIGRASKITDDGLRDLWRLQRLSQLRLEVDGITGKGFGPLAEAQNIHQLRLRSNSLQDIAFDHISALKSLNYLTISEGSAQLTDEGLMMLAEAPKLRHVEISLNGTQITDEGIARLKRAMPSLRIEARR